MGAAALRPSPSEELATVAWASVRECHQTDFARRGDNRIKPNILSKHFDESRSF
jgi:hypothetical protein